MFQSMSFLVFTGKGKLVDILAEKYDICGRFNGGANAGHTIVVNKKKYAFHLLPCGILYPNCTNVLGNGVVVNLSTMFEELKQLDRDSVNYAGRLLLSDRAHLVVNGELELDAKNETKGTGTGKKTDKNFNNFKSCFLRNNQERNWPNLCF